MNEWILYESLNRPVTLAWPRDPDEPTVQNPHDHHLTTKKSKNTVQNLQQACEHHPQQKSRVRSTSPNANGKKITLEKAFQQVLFHVRRLFDLSLSLFNGHKVHGQVSSSNLPSFVCHCARLLAFSRDKFTFHKPAWTCKYPIQPDATIRGQLLMSKFPSLARMTLVEPKDTSGSRDKSKKAIVH